MEGAAWRVPPPAPPTRTILENPLKHRRNMIKNASLLILLGACVGVPYVVSNGGLGEGLTGLVAKVKSGGDRPAAAGLNIPTASGPTAFEADRTAQQSAALLARGGPTAPPPSQTPPVSLEEAIRFDVTKNWVLGHWPRVSTRLSQLELEGYRVPLITGTHEGAVAGSLTYYFNKEQKLQRIILMGKTGDTRPLVTLVTGKFGFTRNLTDDPGLYLYQVKHRRNKAESELRIRAADVVEAMQPFERYTVALWIERPKDLE